MRVLGRAFGWLLPCVLLPVVLLAGWTVPVWAAPGLCVGPVCGQEITRSPTNPWQLRLRVDDQRGRHERIVVDCRDGVISPRSGSVERGYAAAVARRACRLAPRVPQAGLGGKPAGREGWSLARPYAYGDSKISLQRAHNFLQGFPRIGFTVSFSGS
jgi:hypothetical protein